jgi:hypothetical protein
MSNLCRCQLVVVMVLVRSVVARDWCLGNDGDRSSWLLNLYRHAKKYDSQHPSSFYQKSSAGPSGSSGTRNCNRDRQATCQLVASKVHTAVHIASESGSRG